MMTSGEPDQRSEELAAILRERIRAFGPMRFGLWMAAALYEPELGYYQRDDLIRWGRHGDYRTAPETSLLFGATFARYFSKCWETLGEPKLWSLVEEGAGAGDFAESCLDHLERYHPRVFTSVGYVISETSTTAKSRSKERLARFGEGIAYAFLSNIPHRSLKGIIFANEFLDASPVSRITRRDGELFELGVGLTGEGQFRWEPLTWINSSALAYLERENILVAEGQIVDLLPHAVSAWTEAAEKLEHGYLITVDYGAEAAELFDPELRPDGSLRAIADHKLQPDPFASPGRLDLTASIDWTAVSRAGWKAGLKTVFFGDLDKFLLKNGILDIAGKLEAELDASAVAQLRRTLGELILPGGMGTFFQVLVQKKTKANDPF